MDTNEKNCIKNKCKKKRKLGGVVQKIKENTVCKFSTNTVLQKKTYIPCIVLVEKCSSLG